MLFGLDEVLSQKLVVFFYLCLCLSFFLLLYNKYLKKIGLNRFTRTYD